MARLVEQLDNGVTVYQVTDDPRLKCNIYCERPYCSPDGRRFLYARQTAGPDVREATTWRQFSRSSDWEFVLCEFDSWEERVVGCGHLAGSVAYDGGFYYDRLVEAGREVVRIDLTTGEERTACVLPAEVERLGHPTVSKDGRHLAYGRALSYDPQRFAVELADLRTGERRILCEDPFICNTHAQFEPAEGKRILVQHNRGCRFAPDGRMLALLGEEGCTIFLVDLEGGITRLPVGPPHTTSLTGHQAWIGETGEIIMTVRPEGEFVPERGNILCLRPGEETYRQIARGRRMNHIGTTPCGRYFCADGGKTQEIILGSPASGETVLVCHSRTSYGAKGFGQCGHPHAYLSPDYRWVVFNSDRTGRPEIYAARVPADLTAALDAAR